MPLGPQHPCKSPGCRALVASGAGAWCPVHRKTQVSRLRSQSDRYRGTAAERGYTSRWSAKSRAFLARYPLSPGVLIPTPAWTPTLAMQFHDLREAARERGDLLWIEAYRLQLIAYTWHPWGAGQVAQEVDHIQPHRGDHDLFWAEWNWQPLTKRAHSKKTATSDGGFRGKNAESEGRHEHNDEQRRGEN